MVASLAFAACSSGNSGSTVPTVPGPPSNQTQAKTTMAFAIPIHNGAPSVPSKAALASPNRPYFIDGDSNGGIYIYFDGQTVANDVAFAPNGPLTAGPGPTGSGSLPNGGSYSYTSQVIIGGNQDYVDVNVAFTTIPGPHKIGVVQTDGSCEVAASLCIPTNEGSGIATQTNAGYVLAENEQTFNLVAGNSNNLTMHLEGVPESIYFCGDGPCDTAASANADGSYSSTVYIASESGDAIPYQSNGSTQVPFDNGLGYTIEELDGSGIVTITNGGPFLAAGDVSGVYGENITVTCKHAGSTTVAGVLTSGGGTGSVSEFTYTAQNYPQAGSVLGSVGADIDFGNQMVLNCTASGTLTLDSKTRN